MSRLLLALAALALAATSAVACGSGDGRHEWRDLDVTLPEGWVVFEDEPTRFSVADGPLGEEAGDPGLAEAAAFFTHEPGSGPDDWRELVDGALGGELERDANIELGGVPATQLIFSHASNGVPMREMVVLVPSRELVILLQPVVTRDQEDGPEVFNAHLEDFQALLSSVRFGAPTGAP